MDFNNEEIESNTDTSGSNDDFSVNEMRVDNRKKAKFNVILANARSLLPKIDSLVDSFRNLELSCAIITESWLRPGIKLEEEIADLEWGKN